MSESEAQRVIDALADRLQRSVVIDDPSVRLLFASRHFGDEDEARTQAMLQRRASSAAVGHVLAQGVGNWVSPGLVPANPEIGLKARVCCPIRWHGRLLGLLLVVDADRTVTTSELAEITRATEKLAPLIAGDALAAEDSLSPELSQLTADLLDKDARLRREAMRGIGEFEDPLPEASVAVLRAAAANVDRSSSEAHVAAAMQFAVTEQVRAQLAGPLLATFDATSASIVLSASRPFSPHSLRKRAEALRKDIGAVASGRFEGVVGIGGEVTGLDRAWVSARQADLALRAAGHGPHADTVRWEDLGAEAVLLRLTDGAAERDLLPPQLQRLLRADRDGTLLTTVRTYLDLGGSAPATAAALHIHRTTLYYRFEKLRESLGLNLDDGATRLALHVGIAVLDQ